MKVEFEKKNSKKILEISLVARPDFTQVDIELAFTDRSRVLDLIEGLVRHIWPSPESWPHLPPLPETPHRFALNSAAYLNYQLKFFKFSSLLQYRI